MKSTSAALSLLLLSGCAHWFGPAHGVFDVVGVTPDSTTCELSVASLGSKGNPRVWTVVGEFRESVIINPSRKGHRIALICENVVVAARTFKYGRDVDIGQELVINENVP